MQCSARTAFRGRSTGTSSRCRRRRSSRGIRRSARRLATGAQLSKLPRNALRAAFSDQRSALAGLKGPPSPQGGPTHSRSSRRCMQKDRTESSFNRCRRRGSIHLPAQSSRFCRRRRLCQSSWAHPQVYWGWYSRWAGPSRKLYPCPGRRAATDLPMADSLTRPTNNSRPW